MKLLLSFTFYLIILAGCFKPMSETQGVVSRLPGADPAQTSVSSAIPSKTSGIINPNSDVPQTIKTEASGAISGSSVTFPPGSLALSVSMTVEEAYPLSESSVLTELGIDTSFKVSNAAAGVIIRPSSDVDLSQAMTLQIPAPTLSLRLAGETNIAVLYRVWNGTSDSMESGIIPGNEISLVNGFIKFDTKNFGAFQAVQFTAPITTKKSVKTEEPIHNVSGVAVIEKSGYVREETIVAAEKVELLTFERFDFSYADSTLSFEFSATLKRNETVTGCRIRAERADGQIRFIDVGTLKGTFKRGSPEAASIKAQLSCFDSSKRMLTSAYSSSVTISEIALGSISPIKPLHSTMPAGTSTSTSTWTGTSTSTSELAPESVSFASSYTGEIGLRSCLLESSAASNFSAISKSKTIPINLQFTLAASEVSQTSPFFRIKCHDLFDRVVIREMGEMDSFIPPLFSSATTSVLSNVVTHIQFHASGGKPPYSWQIVGQGSMPSSEQIAISASGYLTGPQAGSTGLSWTVRLSDTSGKYVDRTIQYIEHIFPLNVTPAVGYLTYPSNFIQFGVTGGKPPYTWNIIGQEGMPSYSQVAISSTGYLTGPTSGWGGLSWTVRISDSSGLSVDKIVHYVNSVYANSRDLRIGELGHFDISNGMGPYNATVVSGSSGSIQQVSQSPAIVSFQANASAGPVQIEITDAIGGSYILDFSVRGSGEKDPTFNTGYGSSLSTGSAFSNQLFGFIPLNDGTFLFGGDAWICCSPAVIHYFGATKMKADGSIAFGSIYDLTIDNTFNGAASIAVDADQSHFYLLGRKYESGYDVATITRHAVANGVQDTVFGSSGIYSFTANQNTKFLSSFMWTDGGSEYIYALAQYPSGKRVYRYDVSSGSIALDTSFGSAGLIEVNSTTLQILRINGELVTIGSLPSNPGLKRYDLATGTALTPNGEAVLPGFTGKFYGAKVYSNKLYAFGEGIESSVSKFLLARYTIEGDGRFTLDSSFNGTGFILEDLSAGIDIAQDMALQPDGKILLALSFNLKTTSGQAGGKVQLRRYLSNGSLDASFGLPEIAPNPGDILSFYPDQIRYVQQGPTDRILVSYFRNNTALTNVVAFIP